MKPSKLKVYKCEFDGRYGNGMAVVAAYNKVQARKLAKDRLTATRLDREFDRMLVSDVPDLTYDGPGAAVVLWTHYFQ